MDTTAEALRRLDANGAAVIELGVPYSVRASRSNLHRRLICDLAIRAWISLCLAVLKTLAQTPARMAHNETQVSFFIHQMHAIRLSSCTSHGFIGSQKVRARSTVMGLRVRVSNCFQLFPIVSNCFRLFLIASNCGDQDPLADGPVIQEASTRALEGGATLDRVLAMLKSVSSELTAPVVMFTYYNPIMARGPDKFCEQARAAGASGPL